MNVKAADQKIAKANVGNYDFWTARWQARGVTSGLCKVLICVFPIIPEINQYSTVKVFIYVLKW